ncbi:lipase 3-like [Copidosoma floridanum]|uniref:lipase 3-like n=1 Tax=Copidosoma floridanum TaxID=29053 RepID=UPI0006C970A6|nr:lipase 3-like [Copidosoma floridanum]
MCLKNSHSVVYRTKMKKPPIFLCLAVFAILDLVSGDYYLPALKEIVNNIESTAEDDAEKNNVPGKYWKCNPDVEMTTPQLIRKEGYPAEAHVVLTDDGYLLTMHRIPKAPGSPAVFLQHGLLSSSSDWVIAGRDKGLAFILSDLGYDVWLGNARGNTYSRSHANYSTSDVRFWDFSWHEMGTFDLPAAISYITKLTQLENVSYIGHSMGTTMFYVMAIEKPEVASKINVMLSLAPVAFVGHMKSPIRLLVPFIREAEFISHYLGRGEFLPENKILKFLAKYGCELYVTEEKICANMLFVISGFDESEFNFSLMPLIMNHAPAGASTKTILHYAQEIKSKRFQRYDYGDSGNMKRYNSTTPPDYDLSKIKVPIAAFWADNDWLASPIDVKRLCAYLPNKIIDYKVNYPKFNHLDYLWAIDAPTLVYKEVLAVLQKYR